MIYISKFEELGKGRYQIRFDTGVEATFYRGDISGLGLSDGGAVSDDVYHHLLNEVLGKRAKKRAMYLLEQMDRTESQLRDKLMQNGYPQECVDDAIDYVKSFHYLDDYRYACTFIRYSKEKHSKGQLTMKLMQKGLSRELISDALEEEYDSDEFEQILAILEKKHYEKSDSASKEFQRMYGYLARRGFKSGDILKAMNNIQ